MFELDFILDTADYGATADAYQTAVVAPAVAEGLNAAAGIVRHLLIDSARRDFDRPSPFTLNSFAVMPAKPGQVPDAVVYVRERAAEYLGDHIHGGVRRAGDPYTTAQGPIVATGNGPRDQYSNLPPSFVRDADRPGDDLFWTVLDDISDNPALVRREDDELEVLAVVVD